MSFEISSNNNKYLIHTLTVRGLSNPNRGQDGRPKTMLLDNTTRSILSSQNRKHDLKNSLQERFGIDMGEQTPLIGRYVANQLIDGGVQKEKAEDYAFKVIGSFVNLKRHEENKDDTKEKKNKRKKKKVDLLKTETIKIQPSEKQHIEDLIIRIIDGYEPQNIDFFFLKKNSAINTALTGRMIASNIEYDVEASLASNFAFSVNDIGSVQTDYFTATDTLKMDGSKGSGHLDNFNYTQGTYYGLTIIDAKLLTKNLGGNKELALSTIKQIVEVLTTSSPSANKNRCADGQTWPSYVMIEKALYSPRSLCIAFHTPIKGPNMIEKAIKALETTKSNFDKCYGRVESVILDVTKGKGSLEELKNFINF